MELTPAPAARPPRRARRPMAYAVLAVVIVALGAVVWKGLTDASTYFYNADEAVARRDDLGDRRFRLQGTVVEGSVARVDDGVTFIVSYRGADVDVHHQGDPPELFQPGIPVVLEGRWSDTDPHFASDRMLVKHTEEYEADHEDRLDDAEQGGSGGGGDGGREAADAGTGDDRGAAGDTG